MKILVLGGAGMLGHKVVQHLGARDEVWWTLRGGTDDPALAPVPLLRGAHALPHVDACQLDALEGLVRDVEPQVLVNCLGVIKQVTGVDEQTAMVVNGQLPHRIGALMRELEGRFVHISTDCVFTGDRGSYVETDAPDATDVYGRSKAAGEVTGDHLLTLRTSMIGRELKHHRSLLDWFLSQNGKTIRGFRRAFWSGVTTLHLAQLLDRLIHDHPGLSGIYHVSSGRTSKFDLLAELRRHYDLDVGIEPDDSLVCDRSLVGTRFERAIGYRCPPLSDLIAELVADPTPYHPLS